MLLVAAGVVVLGWGVGLVAEVALDVLIDSDRDVGVVEPSASAPVESSSSSIGTLLRSSKTSVVGCFLAKRSTRRTSEEE